MISSKKMHTLDSPRPGLATRLVAPLVLAFAFPAGAASAGDDRSPELGDCQQLQVDAGNTVSAYLYGVGTQNYQWDGRSWMFVAPEAMLFADRGYHGLVAVHFDGPTWGSRSGSQVVASAIDRCTPDSDSIPWLKLAAVPQLTHGPGIFNRTTFVQRLNTSCGKAPCFLGDYVGQVVKVPYTADYVFYRQSD